MWNLYFEKNFLGVTIIFIVKLILSFMMFSCIKVFILSWNIASDHTNWKQIKTSQLQNLNM